MRLRIRFLWLGSLLGAVGLSIACGGVSPHEQAWEATVAALQSQVATFSAPTVPVTATPLPAPDWRGQYIGVIIPPLPQEWEVANEEGAFSTCQPPAPCASNEESYSVSLWRRRDASGKTVEDLFVFEKVAGYDLKGTPLHVILDILVGSEIVGGDEYLSVVTCRVNGNPKIDEEIHAVVFRGSVNPPARAWRANHLSGHFEEVATQDLFCVDGTAAN